MTTIKEENKFDAIIIGGGPAGASCALWLEKLNYKPALIEERSKLGGLQNDSPYPNQWIAVLPGQTGQQVAASIQENLSSHKIHCHLDSTVFKVISESNGYRVKFSTSDKVVYNYFSTNIVVASGVQSASGGLQASKNILIGPGKQLADYSFGGKDVAILGGGDSAFENYEFIKLKKPKSLHIYARFDAIHTLKARAEFLERIPRDEVSLHQGTLQIDEQTYTINGKKYDVIVVLYGWTPHIPFLQPQPKLNERGFIKTNPATTETSLPNIYAIGEVAQRSHPCCVTAMADGVIAAKAIQSKFEAFKKSSISFFSHNPPKKTIFINFAGLHPQGRLYRSVWLIKGVEY